VKKGKKQIKKLEKMEKKGILMGEESKKRVKIWK